MDVAGFGKAIIVTATAVAALTACGSDNNVPTAGQGAAGERTAVVRSR